MRNSYILLIDLEKLIKKILRGGQPFDKEILRLSREKKMKVGIAELKKFVRF